MRCHIPGLHARRPASSSNLNGIFLVRVERAPIAGIRRSLFAPFASLSSDQHFPSMGLRVPQKRKGPAQSANRWANFTMN
jgi:hypothetical protein